MTDDAATNNQEPFDNPSRPRDDNHAILVGMVLTALLLLAGRDENTEASPVMTGAGRDYTDSVMIERPSGMYLVRCLPIEVREAPSE